MNKELHKYIESNISNWYSQVINNKDITNKDDYITFKYEPKGHTYYDINVYKNCNVCICVYKDGTYSFKMININVKRFLRTKKLKRILK